MTISFDSPPGELVQEKGVLLLDKYDDDKIWKLTMNRPQRMNSMGAGMPARLTEAFEMFRDDKNARVCILTGAGRAFCAGADLRAMTEMNERRARGETMPTPAPPRTPLPPFFALAESLNLWKPVIAAVNGYAIAGGFMYAMQCDLRILAESARVGIAESRWNLPAVWAAPLTRQIGLGAALELCMWGDTQWTAKRAYDAGWANVVVPDDKLMDTAMEWARRAVDQAPRAQRNFKEMLYRACGIDTFRSIAIGQGIFQNLVGMKDTVEGPKAFTEKRRPNFTDA